MSEELKPCPFCVGEAELVQRGNSIRHFVVKCLACRAEMKGKTQEEAIAAWNRRAEPATENAPLAPDELRGMGGEPVWIVTLDGTQEPMWEIIVSAGEYGIDLICVLNGVETSDYAAFDLYNDTWLAYRCKPEGV